MSMKPDKSFWLEVKEARLRNIADINAPWAERERQQLSKDIAELKKELKLEYVQKEIFGER